MAIFSIFRQTESYIFSLTLPTESPKPSEQTLYAPFTVGGTSKLDVQLQKQVDDEILAAVAESRRRYGRGGSDRPFERLGQFLFNFLPLPLQNALLQLQSGLPIILISNDHKLPWELLHDGQHYLALKHPVGRSLWGIPAVRSNKTFSRGSLLLISNPTEDLEEADFETEMLMDDFLDSEPVAVYPELLARSRATKWNVLEELGKPYDIIHYSGHAKPGGLLLADGQLTTEQIRKTLKGRPFVFLNACQSASSATEDSDETLLSYTALTSGNLAQAFIQAGAIGFVGTLWPVFDHSSRQFAQWFYSRIRKGLSVGEALRQTRAQMIEAQPDDPIWASFVLVGNPTLRMMDLTLPDSRPLTVLVARLTGLLPLFNSLELEAAAKHRDDVMHSLKQVAERYGGQLHAVYTETVKVYFGGPKKPGKDAKHAILAALDMIAVLGELDGLGLRVGISTGRVLVRRAGAESQIVGAHDTVAAALAFQAGTGQIVVDEATHRSVRSRFTFQPLKRLAIDLEIDKAEPSPRYRVIGTRTKGISASVLVGRERELAQLRSYWRDARKGRGRVVAIVGASGVGKTCLLEAFRNEITSDYQWVSATCQDHEQGQSYRLLAQLLCALAKIKASDDQDVQRHQLRELIRSLGVSQKAQLEEGLALLGRVVGLPFPLPAVDNLEPEARQKMLVSVVKSIFKKAAQEALVLALEDLQWADEASLAVLAEVVKAVERTRLLLLTTYRRDWSWGHLMHLQYILLDELSEEAQRTLLAHLLGMAEPPEELAKVILKLTGGHPLFIEEYIRLLKEKGFLKEGQIWNKMNLTSIPNPSSLEHLIQARLDQLTADGRQMIRTASVIGEKFEDKLLEVVPQQLPRSQVDQNLGQLLQHHLINELGWPNFFYSFRHGLVYQTIYNLQPKSFRRAVHRQVAQALIQLYKDEEKILSRLAHHYYHSHDRVSAIAYCLRAAKLAASQWANQTALDWCERALEKINSFDQEALTQAEQAKGVTPSQIIKWHVDTLSCQANVQKTIGQAEDAIKGYTQALELMATDASVRSRADLYHKLATAYQDMGQFDAAQDALNKGLQVLDGQVCLEAGRIHVYTGLIHFRRGRLLAGLASCEEAIAIISKTENNRDLAQAYNLQGLISHHVGESEKALKAYEQSIALYEQAQYLPGQERAFFNLGTMYTDLGQWDAALDCLEKSRALSDRTGEMRRQAGVLNTLGEIYRRQGKLEEAILAYEEARQILEELGFFEFVGVALMNQGATYLKKGAKSKARACLEESLSLFQRLDANVHLPEALRYFAELELLSGNPTEALQLAQNALNLVRKQAQKLEEGQVKRVLGQIYCELGLLSDAKTQLEESHTMLKERNNPYEIGLTLVELALLRQKLSEHDQTQHPQAIAQCERAITIFKKLGAALDLKRAQEIREFLN